MPNIYDELIKLVNSNNENSSSQKQEFVDRFQSIENNFKSLYKEEKYKGFFSTTNIELCINKLIALENKNDDKKNRNILAASKEKQEKQEKEAAKARIYADLTKELERVSNNLLSNLRSGPDKGKKYDPNLNSTMPIGNFDTMKAEMINKIGLLGDVPEYNESILNDEKVKRNSFFKNIDIILKEFYDNIFKTLFSSCEIFIKKDFASIKVQHPICSTVRSMYTLTSRKNIAKVIVAISKAKDDKGRKKIENFFQQYYILTKCYEDENLKALIPNAYSPETLNTLFKKKYGALGNTPKDFCQLFQTEKNMQSLCNEVEAKSQEFITLLIEFQDTIKKAKILVAYFILCKSYQYTELFGHLTTKHPILPELKKLLLENKKNLKNFDNKYAPTLDSFFENAEKHKLIYGLLYSKYIKSFHPKYDTAKEEINKQKIMLPEIEMTVTLAIRGLKNQSWGEIYLRNIIRINLEIHNMFEFSTLVDPQKLSTDIDAYLKGFNKLQKYIKHNINAIENIDAANTFPPFMPHAPQYFAKDTLIQEVRILNGQFIPSKLSIYCSEKTVEYQKALATAYQIYEKLAESKAKEMEITKLCNKNPPSVSENIKSMLLTVLLLSIFLSSISTGYQNAAAAQAMSLT